MTSKRTGSVAALVLTAAALGACASAGGGSGEGNGSARDVITQEQLGALSGQTAYQAVQKLKPRWFQRRGQVSFMGEAPLIVVIDESLFETVHFLHSIQASDVREIRFLDRRRATLKFGKPAEGGAILVSLRP